MRTITAHKPFEFQAYQLRNSPLRDDKVTKITDFGIFRQEILKYGAVQWFAPAGRKTEKIILILAVFCR